MSKTKFDKLAKCYEEDLLNNLSKFVSIISVYDESTASKKDPFGVGVSNALSFIDDLAKRDGFKSTNIENKIVEILCGNGKKNITVLAHADVVPAGTGWDQDPFTMTNRKGVLYGRGVADDKGPLLSAYYAMKLLRDNNLLGDYTLRFLVGGNEETGSAGVEYYFNKLKKPQPDFGFSPDSDFPLIFAEKGILGFEVKCNIKIPQIKLINGGVAHNSVIERCEIDYYDDEFVKYLSENHINFKIENNHIVFIGKAAHGAMPWMGVNSGMICLKCLADYFNNKELLKVYDLYNDTKANGIGANAYSKEMGDNSLNVGIIKYEKGVLTLTLNFRYVDTCSKDKLIDTFVKNSKPFNCKCVSESPLLYYPKDSVLISTLLRSYQEETGDKKSQPLAIGGGTYAKEADNTVAFGLQFPGWDADMHSPGEKVKIEHLMKGISIYANAIVELGKKL